MYKFSFKIKGHPSIWRGHIERSLVDHDPARKGSQIGEEERFEIILDEGPPLNPEQWPSIFTQYEEKGLYRSLVAAINSLKYDVEKIHRGKYQLDPYYRSVGNYEEALDKLKPKAGGIAEIIFALVILCICVATAIGLGFYISARDHLHRNPPDTPHVSRSIDVNANNGDTTTVTITDKRVYIYKTLTNEQKKDLRKTIKD